VWLPAAARGRIIAINTDVQVEEEEEEEEVVVVRTLEEVPDGATHWSKRNWPGQAGISPSSVLRIWRALGLQPWRTETFKVSPDPLLIDKIRDVAGLYLARRRTPRVSGRNAGLRGGPSSVRAADS
jgi:hypothetical protein